MTTSVNDITGNLQKTRGSTDAYRDGWDRIFSKSDVVEPEQSTTENTGTGEPKIDQPGSAKRMKKVKT